MNRTTGKIITALFAMLITMPALAGGEGWIRDYEAAKKQAAKEGKSILIEFTGSDWCPPCKMLKAKIFDTKHFSTEAPKDFVLLMLDYPNDKSKMSEKEIAQNDKLSGVYGIEGFPTVILADAKGRPYARTVGLPGTDPVAYVKQIKEDKETKLAKRNKKFKEANAQEGLNQAKALDKILSEYSDGIVINLYDDEVKTILAADAENKAGLKAKYEGMKLAIKVQKDIQEMARGIKGPDDFKAVIDKIDKYIEKNKLEGPALQTALFGQAPMVFQSGQRDKAQEILERAYKAAPESTTGKQIMQILKQAFPTSKLIEKKG